MSRRCGDQYRGCQGEMNSFHGENSTVLKGQLQMGV
jgi:hypothetical protein